MLFICGAIIVTLSVIGGFVALGGHLFVLWQPFEFVIICGAALGAFVIANPKTVLFGMGKALGQLIKGPRHTKESYLELLSLPLRDFQALQVQGHADPGTACRKSRRK